MSSDPGPRLRAQLVEDFRREVVDKLGVTFHNGANHRHEFPTPVVRQCEEFLVELFASALLRASASAPPETERVAAFVERCREIRGGSPNAFYQHVDAFCAASANSPEPRWRPIQTAPKDRRIVVWLESDRKGLVGWNEKAQRWNEYGMGFCDPLYWFDVPAPDLDDAGETHDTVLS
jgi:hypothetical protein